MSHFAAMPLESPLLQRQNADHLGDFTTDDEPVDILCTIIELAEALLTLLQDKRNLAGKKRIRPELVTTFSPAKPLLPEFMTTLLPTLPTTSTGGAAGGSGAK